MKTEQEHDRADFEERLAIDLESNGLDPAMPFEDIPPEIVKRAKEALKQP